MAQPAPEVDFVLSAIKDDWQGTETDIAFVPLERIDRDNTENIDSGERVQSEDLEELNIVSARSASRDDQPMGTEYDLKTERVVGVKVEGMHVSEYGAIDPDNSSSVTWNTTNWDDLTTNIRRSILNQSNREYPAVSNRTNAAFKDLRVENYDDQSSNFGDYYLVAFDVRFTGFETLP